MSLLGGKAFSFRSIILISCLLQAIRSIALKLSTYHESQVLEIFAFSLSYYYVCLIVTSCIFVFLSSGLEAWKVIIACAWLVLLALFLSVESLSQNDVGRTRLRHLKRFITFDVLVPLLVFSTYHQIRQ